jgi:hypothetical protein
MGLGTILDDQQIAGIRQFAQMMQKGREYLAGRARQEGA